MGFWDEFWKDMDKPCFAFQWESRDDEELILLREENRKLKLIIKKIIDQSGTEERRLKKIAAEAYLLE